MMKYIKWAILSVCLIIFCFLTYVVFRYGVTDLDVLADKFAESTESRWLTLTALFFTNLGGAIFLIAFLIFSFIFFKDKRFGVLISINLCMVTLLNLIVKELVHRPRPIFRLIEETGYSFPSGHSMISFAFYGFIIYLVYRYVSNKKIKWILISFLSFLILFIGMSRIYLGVHYTTDVIGGFLLALIYLVLYVSVVNKFVLKEK